MMRALCTIIFLIFTVDAADRPFQQFDAIINLGGDCQVAYQLSKNGLRHYALPFDALITPYDSLKEMLQKSFEGFMAPDNFELVREKSGSYILDKLYGTRLLHDFKVQENFLKDYQEVSSKYQRRIERLMERIVTSEYPLFIRKILTREQAVELRTLLFAMRQGRPFLLVVVGGMHEMLFNWHLEGVRNYYLRQPQPYSWKGDSEAWKEIFNAVSTEENIRQNAKISIKNNKIKSTAWKAFYRKFVRSGYRCFFRETG